MEVSYLLHALTTTLFILLNICSSTKTTHAQTKHTQFIKSTCGTTTDPDLCLTSLSTYAAAIHSNHKLMTITALSVAASRARYASSTVKNMTISNTLKPREASAISDCIGELGDSVEELRKSVEELKGGDEAWLWNGDIETWVSAALTDEDTCMEGFSGEAMNGDVKESVRGIVNDVARFTSIALSLSEKNPWT